MRASACGVVVCLVLTCAVVETAEAQDMVFAIDETGPDPSPGISEQPSQTLATALAKYDLEQNAEAAVLLQRVVEGTSADSAPRVQQAQFYLAKALLRLGYLQSASAVFDEITAAGRQHPYFAHSLPWLLERAHRLPDPAPVVELVGRFDNPEFEQSAGTLSAERAAELWLLAGKAAVARGAFEPAAER